MAGFDTGAFDSGAFDTAGTGGPASGFDVGAFDGVVAFDTGEPPPPLGTIGPIVGVEVHVVLIYVPEDSPAVSEWDTALWDSALWVNYADALRADDISCAVETVSWKAGRDLPLDRFRTGTCSVTVNNPDGRYSPWVTPGAGIRPGIDLAVWVETSVGIYPRFRGIVTSITDLFDPDGRQQVQFDVADYLSLLAAYDGLERNPVGDGEYSGARLHRIADTAGYDRSARAFDAGNVALQATTLAKNALDEAGLVCDSTLGVLFAAPDGTLVHRDRNGLIADPHYTTVQATFGEIEPELCYRAITLAADTNKLENVVSIANVGGSAVTIEDGDSRAKYGTRTHRRYDLIHDDPAVSEVIARRHLDFYAEATHRVESLSPVVTVDTLDALLPLDLLWRIQVRRRAEGVQVVADLQIEAISEQITADEWTIEYTTFSADEIFDVARWDTALWDTGKWGY